MSAALCVPASFAGISLFGGEILSVEAAFVTNHGASVPAGVRFTQPSVEVTGASFCNVTVIYTHPGQGDRLVVEAWLPPTEKWNERLQAVGGGGFVAGRSEPFYGAMSAAVWDGYATLATNAGLGDSLDPTPWALLSPGNVNLYALQNLASVSLDDAATIGKAAIKSYYGRVPKYSYWNGCSQGGRQGLMLAQRYPTQFDGIAAGAPGINWNDFFPAMLWPYRFMNALGEYPRGCELQALTTAAAAACDGLDGVTDGVIADVDACRAAFDPFDAVGIPTADCPEAPEVSHAAAAVINATWQGPVSAEGARLWPGLNPGTNLAVGVAATDCTGAGGCEAVPLAIAAQWMSLFVARDPNLDLANLSHSEFDWLAHQGRQRYDSIMGTQDPDLSAFRNAGGKIITFHGLIDELLPSEGTVKYYNEVSQLLPDTRDFFRHFDVPGMGHCTGGASGEPISLFDQLRAWVENGTAPEQSPVKVTDPEGVVHSRIVCPYPEKSAFDKDCGAATEARCWSCA